MFRNLKGKGNGDFTIKLECIKVNVNARDKSEANLLRRRFLSLDLGGVGASGTPLGVTQKSFEFSAFWFTPH